jgi:ribosome-associated protein
VREASHVTDYFLVTTAYNRRHIKALCEDVATALKKRKAKILGTEGLDSDEWALLDAGGFVVHVFGPASRAYYDLDLIWGDVPSMKWEKDGP